MKDLGYKQFEIAQAVNLDPSRIREIFRDGKKDATQGLVRTEKVPPTPEELEAKWRAMLEFSPEAFRDFYEEFSGHSLPAHCLQWIREFIDHRNLMLNVPPRHMKSTIFSCWVPVWLLTINRDEQIILVSKTNDLAKKWASDIANILEFNDHLIDVFGRYAPERKGDSPWRPGQGQLLILGRRRETRGMQLSVLARGSGQQILGMEATVVIIDDPTDAKTANSETENLRQLNWLREEVLSRVETPKRGGASGRAVIVGQRVHFRDIYGQISAQVYERGEKLGQPLWTVITHPAINRWRDEDPRNPEPSVLWPDQWPYDELMIQYERVGGHKAFETMFQQNPLPDDAKLVHPSWWEDCRDHDRAGGVGYRKPVGEQWLPISRVLSLDPSPRRFNGLVIADVVFDREKFTAAILETDSFQGNLHDIIERLEDKLTRYRPDYFVMEQGAVTGWAEGDPLFVDIKRRVKFLPHATSKNKADPELGLESLAGDIERGGIRLPYGDEWGQKMSGFLEDEMNVWPFGEHDDVMMALWFIKYNYRRFVPPGAYAGHFQGHAPSGWSFLGRDQTKVTQDTIRKFRSDRELTATKG